MRNYTSIITHGGVFHADDLFACAYLQSFLGPLPIIRRDPTPAEMADPAIIKIDVGGVFDVGTSAYDHHQRGFAVERDPEDGYGIAGKPNPLAAFGLVWHNFPQEVRAFQDEAQQSLWHARVDQILVRGVDAADCGKSEPTPAGNPPSVSAVLSWMNPDAGAAAADRDEHFMVACFTASHLMRGAFREAAAWVTAREKVMQASAMGGVLQLDEYAPWQEHIFQRADQATLLYVVFPSERGGYMLQQVPVSPDSFEGRKPLPAAWAGLRDGAFQSVTEVADAKFCHPGRFCCGAESMLGTMQLAQLAIEHVETK
jgi:uncharacterized UPF0160 family protein